jgi:hypothetical protein
MEAKRLCQAGSISMCWAHTRLGNGHTRFSPKKGGGFFSKSLVNDTFFDVEPSSLSGQRCPRSHTYVDVFWNPGTDGSQGHGQGPGKEG